MLPSAHKVPQMPPPLGRWVLMSLAALTSWQMAMPLLTTLYSPRSIALSHQLKVDPRHSGSCSSRACAGHQTRSPPPLGVRTRWGNRGQDTESRREGGAAQAPEQVGLTPLPVALSTTLALQASLTPKAKRRSSPRLPGLFKPQEAAWGQARAKFF